MIEFIRENSFQVVVLTHVIFIAMFLIAVKNLTSPSERAFLKSRFRSSTFMFAPSKARQAWRERKLGKAINLCFLDRQQEKSKKQTQQN